MGFHKTGSVGSQSWIVCVLRVEWLWDPVLNYCLIYNNLDIGIKHEYSHVKSDI